MKYFKIIIIALLIPILSKAQAVYFRLGTGSDIQGSEVVIPVTVENFSSIISMQGTISFNPSVASFAGTQNFGLTNLGTANFGLSNVGSGKLTFSWYDPDLSGETISNNDTVFCLRFILTGSAGMSSVISIDNSITPIEVIHSSMTEKLVYTQSGLVSVTNSSATDEIMLSVASDEGSTGQTIQIPVSVRDFNSIVSAQGSISFNPSVISFLYVDGFGLPGMNSGNFGTTASGSGIITFSWNDPGLTGVSLSDDSEIFILNFEIIGTSGQSSSVSLTNNPTPLEFVNTSLNVLDYTLSQGLVTVGAPYIPDNIALSADSVEGAIGQYVQVSVTATDFSDIISMQGSLSFDPTVAQFDQITYFGLPDMSVANFGTTMSGTGKISFSWNDADLSGESLSDNSILFTLQFLLIGNIGDQTPVSFTNIPTPFEFIKSDFSEIGYSAIPGNIKIIDLYGLEVLSHSETELCAGSELSVQYSAIGDFTVTNVFTAYLSDENGSFASPVSIGSLNSNVSGTIDAIIPANTINGTNYKIKIEASDPVYSGTESISSLIIHALPTADAGTDVDICTGNSTNLLATGGVDFEWNGGQTSATINVSPLVDTEYTVTVTDVYGCENSDAVMVFVHSLPVANAGTDQNICFGETANLSATGGVSYEWNSGQLIADITVAPTITTDYVVTVTDIWSCENTDTVTVNVFQVFANAGTDEEICSGGSITLTATGGSSYEWNSGPTTDIINVSPLADTEYIVTVTGVNSCQDVDTVLVTVHDLPTADAGTDVDICTGNSTNLLATGGVDFEWNSGQTSALINVSPLVDTEYTVTVTDVYGCENTDAVMVFVHSLPVANAGTDQNICFGETADLSATGGVSYEWNSGQLIADITVAPTITTDYIVSVTDIWSCENTDTVTVNVFQVFANAGTDEEMCSGGSVTLTATGGSSYEWNSGQTTDIINVSPLVDTEYIVTVTGVNSCQDVDTVLVTVHDLPTADAGADVDICTGNSTNLLATGGVDFEWNSGQTSALINVSPLVDTEYTVTVTDVYGCENTDAVMVFVHSLPVANAGTDQNICFGETADLSATGGVSYEWNSGQLIADITVAPTITTDYIVSVTDIWSCENTDTVTVNVFQVFANAGTDEEMCSGGSVTLTATGGSSYEWNSGPTTDVINVSPLADTEYIVTVTGVNSCQDVDTVLVTVHDLPTADAGTDVDICTGNSTNLLSTGGVDFEWNGGQTSATISVSPLVDTEYTVTVTDSFGCENSDAVMVFVHSLPVANAGTDQNICFGETANLSATGGVSYEWNSGQLVADITIAPTIITDYIVTVTDIWSCENTDTVTVNVFQVFANAGTDEEICSGGSVTLTATGGSSYEWNSGPTTDVINVSPLADTEYIVTVTGVNSCQDVDTVLVTVHDLPTADAGTDVDICTGNSANLTATGGVDFEWSSGQTSASINVSPLVDTEYTVTVTDVYGCENSDAVMVFVHSLPVANAGTDQNICFGETADLSATGGVTYEWNSGQLIADITVAPTITTDYIVTVTDIWSCENTDTVTVNVFQVFANAGTDEEICSGGSITLTATGGSSYEWNSGPTTDVINVSPL
ncbi:MAG: hypothetical protein PHE56_01465, partial [Bacteroidales bacterium]|nr:hypothetical protein [Bacteroidales bacterium]